MDGHRPIKVGSRKSELALIQTRKVIEWLKEKHPFLDFDIVTMTTTGDQILDTALAKIGEKNLFTKELENALLDNSVDFVVHSLKDLPTALPAGLLIGAVCRRDDPRDAVVMRKDHQENGISDLAHLPAGSVIGTSSLRRTAQLKRKYPNLCIEDVRGNLNTRLRKLDDDKKYDCLILALAGLERMNWHGRVSKVLDPETECMFAIGQGAMAVECREGDHNMYQLLKCMQDSRTTLQCIAERAFLKTLEGGCSVPIGVYSEIKDFKLVIKGGVFSINGEEAVGDELEVTLHDMEHIVENETTTPFSNIICLGVKEELQEAAQKLGQSLAMKLVARGARKIVEAAKDEIERDILQKKKNQEALKLYTAQA